MKINHSFPMLGLLALVANCAVPPPALPSRPAPTPTPAPAPPPRPTPAAAVAPAPPAQDWRDAPLTPGDWSYRALPFGSLASFGEPGVEPVLSLRCDRASATVKIERTGTAPGPVPMSLVTTSMVRPLSASPVPGTPATLQARLSASDPALDAMAFSRGRIAVEVSGLPTLIVPAWEEIDRVIEDCR